MNTKEYISSGIIESYVLGLATDAERQEFESMCKLHPEIAEARNQFELALEKQLLQDAVQPPAHIKQTIQQSLASSNITSPAKPIGEQEQVPVRRLNFWKIAAAASIILLAGSLIWAFSLYNKYQDTQHVNEQLRSQIKEAENKDPFEQLEPIVQRPSVKWSALLATENPSNCRGHIYWDSLTKDTYLLIGNLPQPASDKQYQLWALINNQPIDLGVFDGKDDGILLKMKNVQNAEAFAITIEKRGGSPTPTMDSMYAIGKL
ncbi:MAG: anti-sigma factor domain-containing protein [Chitinophagaceae bacterium]